MTAQERESEITRLKGLIESNYQTGDLEQARRWAACMAMLIAGRSDEIVKIGEDLCSTS